MKEPTPIREALTRALDGMARVWIDKHKPHCDWCHKLLVQDDLRQYLSWCLDLGKLWPSTQKHLPDPKVFCNECAVGAIHELIDGTPYIVGNQMATDEEIDVEF